MTKEKPSKQSQFSRNCRALLGDPAGISLEALASEMQKQHQAKTVSGPLLHQWMTVTRRPREFGLEALYKAVAKWRPLVASVAYPEFRDDLLAAPEETIIRKYREPKSQQATARANGARIQINTLCGPWLAMWTIEHANGRRGYQVEVLNLGLNNNQDAWLHAESWCPRSSEGRPYIQKVQLQLGDNAQNVVGVWHDLNTLHSGSVTFYLEPTLEVMKGKHLGVVSDNSVRVGDWLMVRIVGPDLSNMQKAMSFRRQWMKLSIARIKRLIEEASELQSSITNLR